jgi:pSer/pThr/pTyr-binding forkhead associated (FHA) protein
MPALLALSLGPDIPLGRGTVMIGRHPACDVRLDSSRVSRRHCLIITHQGDVEVRDLGSTNGTWINGRRVASGRIRPGDEVSIAHIRYHLAEATSPRPAGEDWPRLPEDEPHGSNSCVA